MDPHVVHNSELSRYELFLGEQKIGHADYRKVDGVLEFPHTEVDPAHQGKNYAAILMRESSSTVGLQRLRFPQEKESARAVNLIKSRAILTARAKKL
jgi:hypothetical protein